jgi:hypothetical protein
MKYAVEMGSVGMIYAKFHGTRLRNLNNIKVITATI